ncbi:PREDICTED: taste receptor cell protein 1-like [Elephantulus edwardii]|uniref:taste receptor cell protein 1-like n=1 Tax=Elephantulus edwardii TaxID=28737 RepID=UPI0003F0B681|nr:PREDICTED: taste receptor cell protein 1-like [Elephantulus edwardii]
MDPLRARVPASILRGDSQDPRVPASILCGDSKDPQPASSVEAYRIPESQPASSVEAHRTPKSQPSFFVETLGTPSSQPVSPVEAHGTPKSQPVSSVRASRTSSSQPVSSVEAHGSPESQPVSSVEAHGSPESQPVSSVEAHRSPESQPVSSVEAHGTPESQPVSSVEAHGSPRSQPVSSVEAHGSPRSQPVSSVEAHGSPESQPASSMEAHGSPGTTPVTAFIIAVPPHTSFFILLSHTVSALVTTKTVTTFLTDVVTDVSSILLFITLISIFATVPITFPVATTITFSATIPRITGEAFSAALMDPTSRKYQLLSKKVRDQLEPVYHNAFPSFEGVEALVLRSSSVRRSKSVAVAASLVFGGQSPSPTSCQVLWTLYCKVKASRQMLGTLSVAEGSLASDGLNMTHLALETIRIHFTVMRPFLSQLSEPDSTPFVQLEEQTLQQVTPVVEKFYKVHPQERPLLLFSNVDQWVDVHIEYKFPAPVPTHNQGLADYLAQNVLDPTLQISSLMANGEKAQLVLYELRLQILDQPFTKALKDKASAESQQLRERLTRGLTAALRHLQNMSQVVVEEFQLDPLTARVGATFFRAAPAEALVHDCVRQGLLSLREAEGLSVKLVVPDLVTPSSGVSAQPSTSIPIYIVALLVLNLLFFILALILVSI